MKFRSTLELHGTTATGLQVPDEVVAGLGTSRKPAVRVTINGYCYRSSVSYRGGEFMLPVSAEHRAGAGIAAGDKIEVDLELDTEPREVTVPQDFSDALDRELQAKQFFDGLSYSNQLRHVLAVEGAKTQETRERRIAKAVDSLKEGKA